MHQYKKPKAYSAWHIQKLPAKCWYLDIDGVEVRKDRGIVGFFELVETERDLLEVDFDLVLDEKGFILDQVLFYLSSLTQVPVFVVYHTQECKKFKVFKFLGSELLSTDLFDEKQYYELILKL